MVEKEEAGRTGLLMIAAEETGGVLQNVPLSWERKWQSLWPQNQQIFAIFGCFWDRILGESSSFWEAWNDSSALAAKLLKALSCTWRGSQEGILFRILTPWWILLVSDDDHDFSSRLVSTKARQICSKISKQVEARDFRSNELRPHVMRSSSVLGSGWAEVETAGKNLKS